MTTENLPGMEIPREFWPCSSRSGGSLPQFLSENPVRLWCLSSNPNWLFCLVIMPGPVCWACLIGPLPDPFPNLSGPLCNNIWTEGFRWVRDLGCHVVQFLVDLPETTHSIPFHPTIPLPKAFAPVTEFRDLLWKKKARPDAGFQRKGCSWIPTIAGDCEEIAVRTMSGSLDCPELAAYRSDKCAWESLIQIHGSQKTCWILQFEKKPAGILLGQLPESGINSATASGEISYFGLVPEFRGKNLGSQMLSQFLWEMAPERSSIITMVDSRNSPACKTYQRVGFENFRTSRLFLAKS